MVGLRSLAHAGAGAIVSIVLSVGGPIGPVAGGFVAGYLEGGRLRDAILVGVLAVGLNLALYVTVWGFFLWGVSLEHGFASLQFGITAVLVFLLLYITVTGGAVGGVTGYYIRTETEFGR